MYQVYPILVALETHILLAQPLFHVMDMALLLPVHSLAQSVSVYSSFCLDTLLEVFCWLTVAHLSL
jgi:hypothetical protein